MRHLPRACFALAFVLGLCGTRLVAQSYEHFIKKLDAAIEVSDRKKMIRTLKDDPRFAIDHFILLVDVYATRGDAKAGNRIELLKELWKEAYDSTLFQKLERFRAALSDAERQALHKVDQDRRKAEGLFEQGKSRKQQETIKNAAEAMLTIGHKARELGHKVLAGRCYVLAASYMADLRPRTKEIAVQQRDAMRQYVTMHEELDWTKGRQFGENKSWLKELERAIERGVIGTEEQGEKKAEEGPAKFKEGSKWQDYPMEIGLQKKPQVGICLASGLNPLDWLGVYLDGMAPAEMWFFKDGPIWLKRLGANKYHYGVSEAAAEKNELPIKSRPEQHYLKYDKGGYEVEYGFFTYLPTNSEPVNDVKLNYEPQWGQRKSASLFFRSASILYADIAGEKFQFFDENCNGIVGEGWNASGALQDYRFGTGWKEHAPLPLFDSMKRAGVRKRLPFSSFVKIDEDWYRLKVTGNNEVMRYRALDPASIPEGKLLVHWKGSKKAQPTYLVVAEVGFYKGAAFDVWQNGRKPVEVPAGKYAIIYGRIQNGRPPRHNNAVVLAGSSQPFDVEAGKTTEITLGAPFQLEFEVERKGDEVHVDSSTFYVKDSYGLRYGCIGAEVLEPELIVSKKNDARNGRVIGAWRAVAGNEIGALQKNVNSRRQAAGLQGLGGKPLTFWPINEADARNADSLLRVKVPFSGPSFVAVRQNKHKLFGKLEHIWK